MANNQKSKGSLFRKIALSSGLIASLGYAQHKLTTLPAPEPTPLSVSEGKILYNLLDRAMQEGDSRPVTNWLGQQTGESYELSAFTPNDGNVRRVNFTYHDKNGNRRFDRGDTVDGVLGLLSSGWQAVYCTPSENGIQVFTNPSGNDSYRLFKTIEGNLGQ